jgi:hypothetical protein
MIRQAINCDMCGAEKQASNYWFVAYEQGGELKLRGWEAPQNSRRNAKHLCGQKCAQRMMANFMASLMSTTHSAEQGKDAPSELVEQTPEADIAVSADRTISVEKTDRANRISDRTAERTPERTDRSLLNRSIPDPASIEADSWAGPARPKEDSWERQNKLRMERESFLNANRAKAPSRLQRTA